MPNARKSSPAARLAKAIMRLALPEQHQVFATLKDHLFPDKNTDIRGHIKDIREARNTSCLCCPHCQGEQVVRFGKYRDRQRYRCKAPKCGKTFNDTTLSPLAGTHYSDKWLQYIQHMVSGDPLRVIANKLGIHLSTAFYWRHKVLCAIRAKGFDNLMGIVESDETYILESHKGHRNIEAVFGRKPRRSGGKAKKRGISKEQVCVLVAQDRQGHMLSQVAGMGRISSSAIGAILGSHTNGMTTLCSDAEAQYRKFAKEAGVNHYEINANAGVRVKHGIFHIQHVNAHHSRLKKWLRRFNGVATRWTDNYLTWFRFVDKHRQLDPAEAIHQMLVGACAGASNFPVSALKPSD
jgi:transposase-like protein